MTPEERAAIAYDASWRASTTQEAEAAIAAAIREAVEEEREACAKLAEFGALSELAVPGAIAQAIRARSATSPSDTVEQ